MKSVLYVSKAADGEYSAGALASVPTILSDARKYNKANGITGVLGLQGDYYLQLLQGPEKAIGHLLNRIRRDRRHEDICMLVNVDDDATTYFEGFSLKLSSPTSDIDRLKSFMSKHHGLIESRINTPSTRKLLQDFGYAPRKEDQPAQVRTNIRQIKLTGWPDFDEIEPAPKNLDACALMIKDWVSIELLAAEVFDGDRQSARTLVDRLSAIGTLLERQMPMNTAQLGSDSNENDSNEFFFKKMRTFIKGQLSGFLR